MPHSGTRDNNKSTRSLSNNVLSTNLFRVRKKMYIQALGCFFWMYHNSIESYSNNDNMKKGSIVIFSKRNILLAHYGAIVPERKRENAVMKKKP